MLRYEEDEPHCCYAYVAAIRAVDMIRCRWHEIIGHVTLPTATVAAATSLPRAAPPATPRLYGR